MVCLADTKDCLNVLVNYNSNGSLLCCVHLHDWMLSPESSRTLKSWLFGLLPLTATSQPRAGHRPVSTNLLGMSLGRPRIHSVAHTGKPQTGSDVLDFPDGTPHKKTANSSPNLPSVLQPVLLAVATWESQISGSRQTWSSHIYLLWSEIPATAAQRFSNFLGENT